MKFLKYAIALIFTLSLSQDLFAGNNRNRGPQKHKMTVEQAQRLLDRVPNMNQRQFNKNAQKIKRAKRILKNHNNQLGVTPKSLQTRNHVSNNDNTVAPRNNNNISNNNNIVTSNTGLTSIQGEHIVDYARRGITYNSVVKELKKVNSILSNLKQRVAIEMQQTRSAQPLTSPSVLTPAHRNLNFELTVLSNNLTKIKEELANNLMDDQLEKKADDKVEETKNFLNKLRGNK